jgi:uroporphyrinogen-III synthase
MLPGRRPLDQFRILLTRQSGFNDELAEKLERLGAGTVEVPVIEVQATNNIPGQAKDGHSESLYSDVIFVSRNAAEYGFDRLALLPELDRARLLAVGEATAGVLESRGVTVIYPKEGVGGEALLALPDLCEWSGRHVLIVRGESGREWLKDELERRGALVEYLVAYRRITPANGVIEFGNTMRNRRTNAIFIHSRSGLEGILYLAGQAGVSLQDTLLVVGAERIRQAAVAAGWTSEVLVAASPGADDMVAALKDFDQPMSQI